MSQQLLYNDWYETDEHKWGASPTETLKDIQAEIDSFFEERVKEYAAHLEQDDILLSGMVKRAAEKRGSENG
jgi:hypothetical protein